ncbi:MAG TPA: carboxypeptidase regulatory-like domain-containing protein [Terracidiphilus sp.]|nr:carboxypeptidase regulatory-like domain-containing protein [Terracidiphilus sp.]
MIFKLRFLGLVVPLFSLFVSARLSPAQSSTLHGTVLDPSGAAVSNAEITVSGSGPAHHTKSGTDGTYTFSGLAPGSYSVLATAKTFASLNIQNVVIAPGQVKTLNLHLQIAIEQQEVTVQEQGHGVNLSPDQNANAMVLSGSSLDAFSDDPDELRNELQALAGPAAGPNGGQIYIDGFAGGRLPPKSSILAIRVNQNPFSAEFDRLGYGRVEIVTKPGSQKLHGSLASGGTSSALNTANPLVPGQPSYYQYSIVGNISGPLGKNASYSLSAFRVSHQNQAIIDALDPQNPAVSIREAFPTPATYLSIDPRLDFQFGKRSTFSIRNMFYRTYQTGSGVGTLNLSSQASNVLSEENQLQISHTFLVSAHFVNDTQFQWSRIYNDQIAQNPKPAVTVQGAFTSGGSSSGIARDLQNNFELHNDSTVTAGAHTLRFGTLLRAYDDSSNSTAGANGSYYFSSVSAYEAKNPSQYSAAVIRNSIARVTLFDGALFFQDDWHWKPNLMMSMGLRFEGQNRIHDHVDWAPRLALAWSPAHGSAKPKTVIRAGYGWFYNRFTVPDFFSADSGTPYVLETIHDNGINQQTYVANDPKFYDPDTAESESALQTAGAIPSYHTLDPHFHAALDMQTGVGIDRAITSKITANLTYLYTQGVHQYMTNNVTAPAFNPSNYTMASAAPGVYNNQFQSGGFYRQNQLIFTASYQSRRWVIKGYYLLNGAKSDTQGVTSFPSVAQNPGFDYGRASFGFRHRVNFIDSYSGPHGLLIATMLFVRSGLPYNLTIGNDLTGNNQFNARPAYGVCGNADVVSTRYGCLDTNPVGKAERIVPYGVGTGPANAIFHLRVSKVIGVGPRIASEGEGDTYNTGNNVGSRGLSGDSAAVRLNENAPRRYSLTIAGWAENLFNIVNLSPPNGVLLSPLFGKSQSTATGGFGSATPGNRSIVLQTYFSF